MGCARAISGRRFQPGCHRKEEPPRFDRSKTPPAAPGRRKSRFAFMAIDMFVGQSVDEAAGMTAFAAGP